MSSAKYLYLPNDDNSICQVPINKDQIEIKMKQFDNEVSLKRKYEIWKNLKYKDGFVYYKGTKNLYNENEIKKLIFRENDIVYHAYLIDGKVNGKGMYFYKYSQNLKFKGDLVDGIPNGIGQTYNKDGCLLYDGQFKNGQPQYSGKFYKCNRLKYNGGIDMGLYEGNGVLYYPNYTIAYEGEFENGKCNGLGKFYNTKGILIYEGEFKNNMFDGEGKYYNNGRLKFSGIFKQNLFANEKLPKQRKFLSLFENNDVKIMKSYRLPK